MIEIFDLFSLICVQKSPIIIPVSCG